MRKMTLALSVLAFSSAAFADSAKPFDGWYIGGNVGYGNGTNQDIYVNPGHSEAPGTERDLDGAIGGIQGGYNWQFDNNIVLGVETGLSASGISGGVDNPSSGSQYYDSIDINQAFNFNFKAGYAIGNWLPYVTAGLTFASMDYARGCSKDSSNSVPDCIDPFNANADDIRGGYNIGAGVEWRFSDNFSTALEYRYTDLGESDAWLASDTNIANDSYARYKTEYQEITLRFNYYF